MYAPGCLILVWLLQDDRRGPKKSWKFLQKYWHKGAFFQDEGDAGKDAVGGDNIFGRDYSAPTGDDKMDKTVLPKVRIPLVHKFSSRVPPRILQIGVPVRRYDISH